MELSFPANVSLGVSVIALAASLYRARISSVKADARQRELDQAHYDARYPSIEAHNALCEDVQDLKAESKQLREMLPQMHKENRDRADIGNEKLTNLAVAVGRIEGALGTKSK